MKKEMFFSEMKEHLDEQSKVHNDLASVLLNAKLLITKQAETIKKLSDELKTLKTEV